MLLFKPFCCIVVVCVLSLILLPQSFARGADEAASVLVIALIKNDWYPLRLQFDQKRPENIIRVIKYSHIKNPAQATWSASRQALLIEAQDGRLGWADAGGKTVKWLIQAPYKHYIQLRTAGDKIYLVELENGTSSETQLLSFDLDMKQQKVLFTQQASQFNPYFADGQLYYSHVSCRLACSPVIQDVWVFDPVSEKIKQLTRLNAISSLDSVGGGHGLHQLQCEWLF